jgi:hypothetical protein
MLVAVAVGLAAGGRRRCYTGSGPSLRDEEGGHMWRCRVTVEADGAGFGLLF